MLMPAVKFIFPYLFSGEYLSASLVIPFAILAAALSGFSLFLGNIFYALHETKSSTLTSLISCAVNLAICYPCIRAFGISGASIAISVSFAFDAVLKSFSLRRKIGYRLPLKTLAISGASVFAGMLIYFYASPVLNLFWACGCLALFGFPLLKPFLNA
jgi:O-antigen/teichoic acid export membrane protein